jgi:hypothetical protein
MGGAGPLGPWFLSAVLLLRPCVLFVSNALSAACAQHSSQLSRALAKPQQLHIPPAVRHSIAYRLGALCIVFLM